MFQINYQKLRKIEWTHFKCDAESTYNPYQVSPVQGYNPIYAKFFTMSDINYNQICLKTSKEFFDPNTLICNNKKIKGKTHIKYAPLLDPIHYLIGKYDHHKDGLTKLPDLSGNCFPKIADANNSSYVDCFFNFLCSKMKNYHQFPNAIDFYGSYLGVQDEFRFDATDDFSYLQESEFFKNKKDILYRVENESESKSESDLVRQNVKNTHGNRPKVSIQDDIDVNIVDQCFVEESTEINETNMEVIFQMKKETESGDDSDADSDDSSNNSQISVSDDDEDEDEDKDEDEDEDEDDNDDKEGDNESEEGDNESEESEESEYDIYVYIRKFPVQMICMEKCDGTLDELLENDELGDDEIESALTQVVFSLLVFQKCFSFTHNDLHTNNIAYVETNMKYIVYTYDNQKYYIPTHGRIFKMIDFGRAIYKFQDKLFCSDSFAPGGDANSQYNFPPFLNEKKDVLEPNMSFDLCRLGCSMFDFVFDEDDDTTDIQNMNRLQRTILRWCTDDSGKNILYKKNGDERYPNFKLYKMISRLVHQNTPQNEVSLPMIQTYKQKPKSKPKMYEFDIDSLPLYYT